MTSDIRTSSRRAAFTLIEVMISMALVLILIIGINQVFKISADTVGTGLALSAKVRDGRAVQAVFYNELSHAVISDTSSPAPFLIIDSRTQAGFKNAADREEDLDGNPLTTDIDSNNAEGEVAIAGENISPATMNNRAHRVDTLSFFARDLYRRQNGNPNIYVEDMSSSEAWVTYGHMRVYDQQGNINADASYAGPGTGTAATNPKNYYSVNWVLGRMAMLLIKPIDSNLDGFPDAIPNRIAPITRQYFWGLPKTPVPPTENMVPFGRMTNSMPDADNALPGQPSITDARYDLIGSTLEDCRTIVRNYIQHTNFFVASIGPKVGPAYSDAWWEELASGTSTITPVGGGGPLNGRFRCNPYPTRPMDSQKMAQTAPVMLNNCTQFAVEYAGDFLTQNAAGALIPNPNFAPPSPFHPDGAVDYFVETDPTTGAAVRHVRWYGFPRDTTGDGRIFGWQTGMNDPNLLRDVVPLRDVMRCSDATSNGYPFEKVRYQYSAGPVVEAMPPRIDYANPADLLANGTTPGSGLRTDNHYVCAWGPDDQVKPTMIRLVVRVDDPNGRLADGQTFEYVINLK